MWTTAAVCVFILPLIISESVPWITKCHRTDSECITKSANNAVKHFAVGNPKYGLKNLSPVVLDDMDASSQGLKLFLKDIKVFGSDECQVSKIRITDNKLIGDIICSERITAHYDIDGQFQDHGVKGSGTVTVFINNVSFHGEADLVEDKGPDGETHWATRNWVSTFNLSEPPTLKMDNLYIDGQLQSELTAEMAGSLLGLFAPKVLKNKMDIALHNIDNFFDSIPVKYLSLDYN